MRPESYCLHSDALAVCHSPDAGKSLITVSAGAIVTINGTPNAVGLVSVKVLGHAPLLMFATDLMERADLLDSPKPR